MAMRCKKCKKPLSKGEQEDVNATGEQYCNCCFLNHDEDSLIEIDIDD